jgi:hypothetical protein
VSEPVVLNLKFTEPGEMTWLDVCRIVFPKATAEECDEILMNHTAFPFAGLRTVFRQLRHYARIRKHNLPLCDCCGRFAEDKRGTICYRCWWAIQTDE